jgi:divalent metal cation (Fe/Co/Zn/Cd) transporter
VDRLRRGSRPSGSCATRHATTSVTGSAFWDGLASVLIAVLLTVVAYILGGTNKGLLIGRQADRKTVYALRDALAERQRSSRWSTC